MKNNNNTKLDSAECKEHSVVPESLALHDEFFREVFMSSTDGRFVIDREYTILCANRTIEALNSDCLPLAGKKCYELSFLCTICDDCPVSEMIKLSASYTARYFKPSSGGNPGISFVRTASPIIDLVSGEISGSVLIIRDIKELNSFENALIQYRAVPGEYVATETRKLLKIRELNEIQSAQLNLVVRATKIGLWNLEVTNGDPLDLNNPFAWSNEIDHLLGTPAHTSPTVLNTWIMLIHPSDRNRVLDRFKKHSSDKTGNTPFDIEHRIRKSNGEYSHFRAIGKTIRDEKGKPIYALGSLLDITDTKNILRETKRLRAEAEAASHAKTKFLSRMSHEIRTPINAILGISEMLLQNTLLDSDSKEALYKIYNSGDLLLGIINDILDFSKIEAGKFELIAAEYDFSRLINDVTTLNSIRLGDKPIEFLIDVDDNIPVSLSGDEIRIKQILNNLLSNALKYTFTGTVSMSVHAVPLSEEDVEMVFTIRDTGLGMSKEQIEKLFDEYARFHLHIDSTIPGTGLGMSITKSLIEMMNGKIFVESEVDQGTIITVHIHQRIVNKAVLGRMSAEKIKNFHASGVRQVKMAGVLVDPMPYGHILIVDDVDTNIYVAKRMLAPYDLSIDTATSGLEAIEKIKGGSVYDIIFMDYMMPKMNGIETTQILRGLGYKHPIVALTANAVMGQAEIFLQNGFDDFITKPVDVRLLNVLLNRLIRDKQPLAVLETARQNAKAKRELDSGIALMATNSHLQKIFVRVAKKSLAVLDAIDRKQSFNDKDDLHSYITHIHGLKSALTSIGKIKLADIALHLESVARAGDIKTIKEKTPMFLDSLRGIIAQLVSKEQYIDNNATDEDPSYLREMLLKVKEACEEYDTQRAESAIEALEKKLWSHPTNQLLSAISRHLLHSDFDEIVGIVDEFVKTE